jgi:hypothetical protein
MIYLDSSVALAYLLGEDRLWAESIWEQSLISSRLLEYETWKRIHARGLGRATARQLGPCWPAWRLLS